MIVVEHVKKGKKRFNSDDVSVLDILGRFGENIETAFVVINGKPATSDKYAKPGDKVIVIPAVSGG